MDFHVKGCKTICDFFHLSDLHIGKQLHHYSLKEDQEHILGEIIEYAGKLHPDAVVIAGDIYDKPVPSAEAVTLFDDFLYKISKDTSADSGYDHQWKS